MYLNRNIVRVFVVLISWALVLQTAPTALAADPAVDSKHFKSLPSDTFGVLHINDVPKTISELKQSVLFKALTDFLESDSYKKAKRSNETVGIMEGLIFALLRDMPKALTGESTFAFTSFDIEENEPDILFIADSDEKEFTKLVEKVLSPAVLKLGGPELFIDMSGKYYRIGPKNSTKGILYSKTDGRIILSPFEHSFGSIKNITKSLADNPLLKSTFEKHADSPDSLLFVNLSRIYEFMGISDEIIPESMRMSGITGIAGIGGSSKSVENGAVYQLTFYAPDGLKGMLNMLDGRSSGPGIEKYVPEDYSFCLRLSVGNFKKLYEDLIALMEKELDEEDYILDEFNDMIQDIDRELGISIEDDLLANLGGDICFAARIPRVVGIPETAVFLEVSDKQKVRKLMAEIFHKHMSFTASEYKGVNIETTTFKLVQPSYAFIDDYLVIAISPAVIQDIIDTRSSGKSILNKSDYQTVFANLPEKGVLTLYLDTKEALNFLVPLINSRTDRRMDIGRQSLMSAASLAVQMNMQETSGFGMVLSADKDSIQLDAFCGTGSIETMLPVLAGVLIIPVTRTRTQARQVYSMNNVKQLCLACKMYALDHDEKFPDKLSVLYPDYVSALSLFQHPSVKHERNITKKEDIDELSDYVIFKGLYETDRSDSILIYEKRQFFEDGRYAGFLDSHAEWMNEEEFQKKLKEQIRRMEKKEE